MKPTKPFLSLTAGDLMNPVVIAIPRQMSVKGAAHLLAQNHISGAPVVDDEGRCIGVVSATDFVFLVDGQKTAAAKARPYPGFCADWSQPGRADSDTSVERFMTANPVTTDRSTPIGALAQKMLDAHIHRVIVVDEARRPVGVMSSTDMLAAIVRAHQANEQMRPESPRSEPKEAIVAGCF